MRERATVVDERPGRVATVPGGTDDAVLRLRATGALDASVHRQVSAAVQRALTEVAARSGLRRIEVDLGAASFLSAAVAGALAHGAHRAAEQQCVLRVINASGIAARVLVISRLWPVLCDRDDVGTRDA
ncbi:STAS domain-containing protein [Cryptosporangium sp. NPDC048952]|uniref:STAS domain-containing protein n=1 Tax=Cryptosporangium sp. NPDC048952 TaxID=3363961 RepID=UPI003722D3DA